MKSIRHMILTVALLVGGLAIGLPAADPAEKHDSEASTLRVYLPREAVVQNEQIDLGTVGIVRGNEAAAARAGSVAIGKFSMAGQQIVIDRTTILAMLAAAGIDTRTVVIGGADSVTVRRNEDVIGPERFLAVAQTFLEEQLKGHNASIVAISRPKPYVMQRTRGEVRLVAKGHPYSIPSRPRVWVDVVADGQVLTGCEVAFSLRYQRKRAVATADIAKGDTITKDNMKLDTEETSHAPASEALPAYGMVARRAIRKGAEIREGMVGPLLPPTIIQRRQAVVVKFETPLLLVSSVGEAMDEGRSGDMIRVRVNTGKDAKIIVTRIGDDGTVSPVI